MNYDLQMETTTLQGIKWPRESKEINYSPCFQELSDKECPVPKALL